MIQYNIRTRSGSLLYREEHPYTFIDLWKQVLELNDPSYYVVRREVSEWEHVGNDPES